jgi:hypothetical protein
MIEGLGRRGGAEEVSPPTRDAPVRKRTCAATFTDLPNLSTFCLCLPLPCMLPTAMHVRTFRQILSIKNKQTCGIYFFRIFVTIRTNCVIEFIISYNMIVCLRRPSGIIKIVMSLYLESNST